MKTGTKLKLNAFLFFLCVIMPWTASAADSDEVFKPVDRSVYISSEPNFLGFYTETLELVRIDFDVLRGSVPAAVLNFTLPVGGEVFAAQMDQLDIAFDSTATWTGSLVDGSGSVTIAFSNDFAYGRIETDEATYRIEPTEVPGVHWFYRLDERFAAATCFEALVPTVKNETRKPQREVTPAEDVNTVDLLVLYTSGFAAEYPGSKLSAQINYLVGVANKSLKDSKINLEVRLVGTKEVDYTDEGDLDAPLDAMTHGKGQSGVFEGIEELRRELGADQVTLLRVFNSTNNYCGLAWRMSSLGYSFADWAYSVVQVGEAGRSYCTDFTMVHEMGHNWGTNHNKNESSGSLYPYGYGNRYVPSVWMTIMSYQSQGERKRGFFSSPEVFDGDVATGTDELNNTRAINNVAALAASWMKAKILDSLEPKNKTRKNFINSGDASTSSRDVKCAIVGQDAIGVSAYHISESKKIPDLDDSGWVAIADGKKKFKNKVDFKLSGGKGTKKVFVRFRDAAGNISKAKQDKIILN